MAIDTKKWSRVYKGDECVIMRYKKSGFFSILKGMKDIDWIQIGEMIEEMRRRDYVIGFTEGTARQDIEYIGFVRK